MIRLTFRCLIALTAVAVLLPAASAQSAVILDDDMSAASYDIGSFNDADAPGGNLDDESSAGFSTMATGGNPDEQLIVEHNHEVATDEFGDPIGGTEVFLQSFLSEQTTSYTPSTSGAIQEIVFSIDINFQSSSSGVDYSTVYFTVDESGGGSFGGFTSILPGVGWQTIQSAALTNADFSGRDFAGSTPLQFGFGFISSGDNGGIPEQLTMGVDNFRVEITPVPEPTSLIMALAGSLCLLRSRRRA